MKRKHDGTPMAQSHSVPNKKRKVGNLIQQLILVHVLVEQQHSLIFIQEVVGGLVVTALDCHRE